MSQCRCDPCNGTCPDDYYFNNCIGCNGIDGVDKKTFIEIKRKEYFEHLLKENERLERQHERFKDTTDFKDHRLSLASIENMVNSMYPNNK